MAGPTSTAAKLVRGKVVRFTLLDECGTPEPTVSQNVAEGIITVTQTKNMDEGDEIKVRQMNGQIGTYEPGRRTLLNYTVEVQVITADTQVLSGITGDPAIVNGGAVIGWTEKALQPLVQNVALELWTDTSAGACVAGGKPVGYVLYPLLSQGYVTMDNVTDKEITFTIHAMSYGNAEWGVGPYKVVDNAGVPGPLPAALTIDDHKVFLITTVAPPAPTAAGLHDLPA